MRGIGLIVALFILTLILIGSAVFMKWTTEESEPLALFGELPEFQFTDQSVKAFGKTEMLGKVSVVDFIFTRCKGPCPLMAVNMEQLYRDYATNSNIQFVSISVEPSHDTPEVLSQYAIARGVNDDRWRFLHAPIEKVVELSELGFKLAADDLPGAHTTRFVLLDTLAQIRGYYSGTDTASVAVIQADISRLTGTAR
ncbi:MAG: SCO family protein [candidate division Zixibacteria bacterium]|nr:SCO family protein [candidate division Zixibacteria bacterium]MDH3935996.1 SCO family protein [candidate division Zixibacteria bacterium]MDH4032590.1 SCO family protein [candidate division Zixibacteria bacterium]